MSMIHAIGIELSNKGWQVLWDQLDAASEAGIFYKMFDWVGGMSNTINSCDAYIYLDIESVFDDEKPFVIMYDTDTEEELISKLQMLAGYITGAIKWEKPSVKIDTPPWEEEPKDTFWDTSPIKEAPVEFEVPQLPEVSEELISATKIKHFEVIIEGKKVCLEPSDMIILSQMRLLMDQFGYKIEKVVL